MEITRFTENINNISRLDDQPNDVGGMSAAELKAEFDKAGNSLKNYINEVLLPLLEGKDGASYIGVNTIEGIEQATNVQAALAACVGLVQQASVASVVDGSITAVKLANLAITAAKLAGAAVTEDKLADGAVSGRKIADGSISAEKLAALGISTAVLADFCVTAEKLAPLAVTSAKMANASVSEVKIADGAVTNAKLRGNSVTGDKVLDGTLSIAKTDGSIQAAILCGTELPKNPVEGQIFLLKV